MKRNRDLTKILSTQYTQIRPMLCEQLRTINPVTKCVVEFSRNTQKEEFIVENLKEFPELLNHVDFCFVFGDLNYRVQTARSRELADAGAVSELLQFDELTCQLQNKFENLIKNMQISNPQQNIQKDNVKEKKQTNDSDNEDEQQDDKELSNQIQYSNVLSSFAESSIAFLPTYKLIGNQYDPERIPSYCDRVIFSQVSEDIKMNIQQYGSAALSFSDHLPVTLTETLNARTSALCQEQERIREEYKQLCDIVAPQLQFDNTNITLQKASVFRIYRNEVVIKNTHPFTDCEIHIQNKHLHIISNAPKSIKPKDSQPLQFKIQICERLEKQAHECKIDVLTNMSSTPISFVIQQIDEGAFGKLGPGRVPHVLLWFGKQMISNKFGTIKDSNIILDAIQQEQARKDLDFASVVDLFLQYLHYFSPIDVRTVQKCRKWAEIEEIFDIQYRDFLLYCVKILKVVSISDGAEDIARRVGGVLGGVEDLILALLQ